MRYKKNINNIHDKSYKDLLANKNIFEDLIKSFVKKSWCKEISKDNLELVNKSFILSDYEEMESDILYKAKIGEQEVMFYILVEMQSTPDYSMPIRIYLYMAEIWREYLKNFSKKEVKRKDFKIPAIIPIVLYNGEFLWTADRSFRKKIYKQELFENNIVDFEYILLDVNRYDKEELLSIGNTAAALFLLDQFTEPFEFIERIKEIALTFNELTEDDKRKLSKWLKITLDDGIKEFVQGDMDELLLSSQRELDIMTANFVKSMKKTIEDEKLEAIIEIATNLLDVLDDEMIAKKTGLEIGVIKKLREEIKK